MLAQHNGTLPLSPGTAALSPTDQRTVSEVMRAIERKLDAAIAAAALANEPAKRTAYYPSRLSPKAREAIKLVLEDVQRRHDTITFDHLLEQANQVEADCLHRSGTTNDSIRNLCAELCGISVRWAVD